MRFSSGVTRGSLALIFTLTGMVTADAAVLVRDGEAAAVIIVPVNALPVVEHAARELRYHLAEASGAELSVLPEDRVVEWAGPKVYLGACRATGESGIHLDELPPAGYLIKTLGDDLYLAGDDSAGRVGSHADCTRHGTLWAVYTFLEEELGVRWLWPGKLGEYIPSHKTIEANRLDKIGAPWLKSAHMSVPSITGEHGWASEEARGQFFEDQQTWLLRHRFAATENLLYGHGFGGYWERFHESHPEYFNLLPNGRREPLPGDETGSSITLCVSQPALWKQVVEDWAGSPDIQVDGESQRPLINLCENDSPALCTCEACRAWDTPDSRFATSPYWGEGIIPDIKDRFHGENVGIAGYSAPWGGTVLPEDAPSLSDRYARFYLSVQQEARKTYPDAVVFGYAYANYWMAPKQIMLNDGVVISYVPPLWFPYTETISRSFRENWDGWRATGARMILRPNLTHAGHNMPVFYARRLAEDFAYASSRGMIGTAFDSLLGAWANQGPTLYVLGRMHLHPDWPVDRMLDEYYAAFGPAADMVRAYFRHWERVSEGLATEAIGQYHRDEGGGGFKHYVLIADRIFTPDVMAKGRSLMNNAVTAAAGDALASRRVGWLDKGLIDAELTLATLSASKACQREASPENHRVYQKAMEAMMRHRASVESENVCNMGYMAYREARGARWEHGLAFTEGK